MRWRDMYLYTALASFFVAVVSAVFILPGIGSSAVDALTSFCAAAVVGFGSNGVSNEIYDWVKTDDETPKVESPPGT